MEALPDDMLLEILEIGIENSTLTCSDLCSVSVCCKHFNKLCNDDALWSMLLTLDFPEYEKSVGVSYSKKSLYKCRLGRWYTSKIDSLHRRLDVYESRSESFEKRIHRLEHRLGFGNPFETISRELLDMVKERNFLLPDFLDETARVRVEEATTKIAQLGAWMDGIIQVIAIARTTPLASPAPSTPDLSGSFVSSSFSDLLDDVRKKMSSFGSLDELSRLHCSLLKNKLKHSLFHYRITKRYAQIAVLEHSISLVCACFDFKEAYDDTAGNDDDDSSDYEGYETEYDTEDIDGRAISSDDDSYDFDTEDDDPQGE